MHDYMHIYAMASAAKISPSKGATADAVPLRSNPVYQKYTGGAVLAGGASGSMVDNPAYRSSSSTRLSDVYYTTATDGAYAGGNAHDYDYITSSGVLLSDSNADEEA
jgi:hypothetical protein